MEQVVLRVLRAEVRRRKCPGCGNSLRRADIEASFRGESSIQLHFRCRFCAFEGGGEFELTPEMAREAVQLAGRDEEEPVRLEPPSNPTLGPISDDEMIDVHRFLHTWSGDVRELIPAS
jgi:hypothetical protein